MSNRKLAFIAFAAFDCLLVIIIVGIIFIRDSMTTAGSGQASQLSELGAAVFPEQRTVADFQLIDDNGQLFTQQNLTGKWNLMFFGFTSCPDVCPLTMNALKLFYHDLEGAGTDLDTRVIMVSVDPQRDTVEAMASYVNSFHQDFIGLTGDSEVIAGLANQLYVVFTEPPAHEDHAGEDYIIQHSGYIAIIDPDGNYHSVLRAPHTRESLANAYLAVRDIWND